MDAGKMGNWLQVGANMGIILGLVLVGFQLKQNSDLLKVQLLFEESQSFISHERLMMGENPAAAWARSLEDPDGLSLQEARIMDAYLYAMTEQWRASHLLHELGILEDEWRKRVTEEAAFYLGSKWGRGWWNVYKVQTRLPAEMVSIVEAELEATPNFTLDYQDDLREARSVLDH